MIYSTPMGKVSPLACLLRQVRVPGSNPGRCITSCKQSSYLGHAVAHAVEFIGFIPFCPAGSLLDSLALMDISDCIHSPIIHVRMMISVS